MLRSFVLAVSAMLVCSVALFAGEIKGKVKSVDVEKKTITVTVEDKDQTVSLADDAKVALGKIKDIAGLKDLKAGTEVVIVTEKKGDKEVAKEVKAAAKKKDK